MKFKLMFILSFICTAVFSQHKKSYNLFDSEGNEKSFDTLSKDCLNVDIVLFGEYHNNPVCHWLQKELTKQMYVSKDKNIILGAEMFERDNQDVLNKYLLSEIDEQELEKQARLWSNFTTDYKPLLDFAKENSIAFVATNIPRKYASEVRKKDFQVLDTLSAKEKKWIAPLPILFDQELSQYKKMLEMKPDLKFAKAQAIKDATMAYSIVENMQKGNLFIHFNGSFHSDFHQGIYWYIRKSLPEVKIMTISTVTQENVDVLEKEYYNQADYILVVDEDFPTSY